MAPNTETELLMSWIALPFALIGFGASIYGVIGNLKHYTKPDFQRYDVGPAGPRTSRVLTTACGCTDPLPQLCRAHPPHDSGLRLWYGVC